MNSLKSLQREMQELTPAMDASTFDPDVFAKTGVFVLRNAVNRETVKKWRSEYYRQISSFGASGRKKGYNPVEFENLKEGLQGIWRDPQIVRLASQVFGPNVGLFKARFVVKDQSYRGEIFLHQDTSYQLGTVQKASVFMAVTEAGPHNGGLIVYPGTKRFGFLGDAGEINREILPKDWPALCPVLEAGDLLLMQSMTWHESGAYVEGPDRVLTDFIYQDANDPSTLEVVAGEGGWETNFLSAKRGDDYQISLFRRCRTKTMKELYDKIDALEAEAGKPLVKS